MSYLDFGFRAHFRSNRPRLIFLRKTPMQILLQIRKSILVNLRRGVFCKVCKIL